MGESKHPTFTNAPLIYALCQIRFSPIMKLVDFIPNIQEKLRGNYPRYQEQTLQTIAVDGPNVKATALKRWSFRNSDERSGFLILSDSIVFHTTAYEGFEKFMSQLEFGLQILDEEAKIGLVERIGLRYVDLLEADDEKEISRFVKNGLNGFPVESMDGDSTMVFTKNETHVETKSGRLLVKYSLGNYKNVLPEDLIPSDLQLADRTDENKKFAVLDTDHFSEKNFEFDLARTKQATIDLHDDLKDAFYTAVTDYGVEQWL